MGKKANRNRKKDLSYVSNNQGKTVDQIPEILRYRKDLYEIQIGLATYQIFEYYRRTPEGFQKGDVAVYLAASDEEILDEKMRGEILAVLDASLGRVQHASSGVSPV